MKKKIRCQECKTVQGRHKKSCSKTTLLTRVKVLLILNAYRNGLKYHELIDLLQAKGIKTNDSHNSSINLLRTHGYIIQEYGLYYLVEELKDPDFFGKTCREINEGKLKQFKEVQMNLLDVFQY